jgi:hypothetical protein
MRNASVICQALTAAFLVAIIGCSQSQLMSSGEQNSPVQERTTIVAPMLWGLWDVAITEDGTVEYAPLHSANFALNVAGIIKPPDLGFELTSLYQTPEYVDYYLDVNITHTIYNEGGFTGFDVCGVVMGEGNTVNPLNTELTYAGPGSLQLLNADGYTRWMNQPEFSNPGLGIFGFTNATAGTPGYNPGATLNPYKYFCDGLDVGVNAHANIQANPASRGVFTEGASNGRQYVVRSAGAGVIFQYAILARWAFPDGFPGPPSGVPEAFPVEANAPEAVAVSITDNTSDMWYDGVNAGGNFTADLSVINWNAEPAGGTMSDYTIRIGSASWLNPHTLDMTVDTSGENYCSYNIDIPVLAVASGPITVWFEITQVEETYANPFGLSSDVDDENIAAYFTYTANVSSQNPTNEFWEPPVGHDPRFLFIHHSCGSGFLFTGGMWDMLVTAGFEVHDRTYGDGWVGDNTDPNHWPTTFTTYYDDMINWEMDPGEYYDIVAFKSCYPACNISSADMLNDYYGYYATVKSVTEAHPETLFIPWSPPPLNPASTNAGNAARARTFANWLVSPYCDGEFNMRSFDCFDVLAGDDPVGDDFNMLATEYQAGTDSHPNTPGDIAVAEAFTAWLSALVWD